MRSLARLLPALVLSAPLAVADVLIVDPAGTHGYSQIQAAIDASQDGDLILVRSGTYAGFALQGRSLTVRGDVNAEVEVESGVSVTDTPAGGVVVLADLQIVGADAVTFVAGENGLTLLDNAGFVRIQGCTLAGGTGASTVSAVGGKPGGDGCTIEDSPRAALVDCVMAGGSGGGDPFTATLGGVGGHGLRTRTSGTVLYDCEVFGGGGGVADLNPGQVGGPGGPACEVVDFGVFAANTSFRGGSGGYGHNGGDGGVGLIVQSGAQAQLLGCDVFGGFGGNQGEFGEGDDGQPTAGGGLFNHLPGEPRVFGAPGLARDGATVSVTVAGEPGDAIWIVPGQSPAHVPAIALGGVWLVARPVFLTKAPLVVLGPSGQATVELPVSGLSAATPSRELYLQGFARTVGGQIRLGSPGHVSIVDCASLAPDCNGSGAFDVCDLLAGGSVDCNANSIPDECEDDCNGNGVADSCDVAPGGGSLDDNENGIPDECEPHGLTWHVDASAPLGGNGSAAFPFRTIAEGIAASLDDDTILVADGVYSGPQNRNLAFGGRDIVVRSANGSAACVIDCDDLGNAFEIDDGESSASRIEGFTIVDGKTLSYGGGIRLYQSHTTIRDVRFVSCQGSRGGGLMLQNSNSLVSDCSFENGISTEGGGLAVLFGTPRIVRCSFTGNLAVGGGSGGRGGAIYVGSSPVTLMSHLELIDNEAGFAGGGLTVDASPVVVVSHALFAGNSASRGGAVQVRSSSLYLRSSTFAGNLTPGHAAIFAEALDPQPRDLQFLDCIAWDDPLANAGIVHAATALISVRVERTDLRGGPASLILQGGSTAILGPGNLAVDPQFADADGPDNNPATFLDNDYRLGAASPCIDAGDNGLVLVDAFDLDGDGNTLEPTPFDLDLSPRFVDVPGVPDTGAGTAPIVDMGAYERQ
jgi:hypothetical protein